MHPSATFNGHIISCKLEVLHQTHIQEHNIIYMVKHCYECFMKNKVQGVQLSTLYFIQHELGDALNDL